LGDLRARFNPPASRRLKRMPDQAEKPQEPKSSRKLRIIDLVRPHWKALTIALVAVLGETLKYILEPWPIKFVVDNILLS
jgi:hypothetical protein